MSDLIGFSSADGTPPTTGGQKAQTRRPLRLAWRFGSALTTSLVHLALVLSLVPIRTFSRQRWAALRRMFYQRWARSMMRVLGVSVRVTGSPPEGGCLLVSNHLSYIDILVIASLKPARFVAKSEIAGWPLIGTLCRSVDTIFVDRQSRRDVLRVAAEMELAVAQGEGVVLFPEGTSTRGNEVLPFKPALLSHAARTGLPVHLSCLRYQTAPDDVPADLSVAWWGGMPLVPHLLPLLQLDRIEAQIHFLEETVLESDRKRLADQLRAKLLEHFEPMETSDESLYETALPAE